MDVAVGNQNKVKYMATQLLAKFEENAPAQSVGTRRQGSMKKEFPQNLGGSDTCYFCQKRVYVMERLSAEGKFFHRSCFKCEYCATTLRLSAYAYDIEDGKFYCKPHYCYRLSGYAQRKRPAVAPLSGKEAKGPLQDGPATDANGRANAVASSTERTPGSLTSLFGWVARHSLGLCDKAKGMSQHLQSNISSFGHQVAQNPLDSFFMCQLLAFGVPFLYGLSEVLVQIGGEFHWQAVAQ